MGKRNHTGTAASNNRPVGGRPFIRSAWAAKKVQDLTTYIGSGTWELIEMALARGEEEGEAELSLSVGCRHRQPPAEMPPEVWEALDEWFHSYVTPYTSVRRQSIGDERMLRLRAALAQWRPSDAEGV